MSIHRLSDDYQAGGLNEKIRLLIFECIFNTSICNAFFCIYRVFFKSLRQSGSARDNFFVITPDHSLVGWGTNEYRLVNSLNDDPVPFEQRRVIMADAMAICFGTYCVFALDTEGTLYGWGGDVFGQFCGLSPENEDFRVKLMENVKMIAAGSGHCMALKSDGSVWTWGSNAYGQLGLGYKDRECHTPEKVMDGAIYVYSSGETSFAIKEDGSLYAWGGYSGESTSAIYAPNYVTSGITAVAFMKENEYQLLTTDGRVLSYKCGSDTGELDFSKVSISPAVSSKVRSVFDRGFIKEDGSLWMWSGLETARSLEKVMDNVSLAAGRSDGFILTVTTDGKFHWLNKTSGLSKSCSMNSIVPAESDLILYIIPFMVVLVGSGVILFIFRDSRHKNTNQSNS